MSTIATSITSLSRQDSLLETLGEFLTVARMVGKATTVSRFKITSLTLGLALLVRPFGGLPEFPFTPPSNPYSETPMRLSADLYNLEKLPVASSESTIADRYFFTLSELANGFAPVVGQKRAAEIARAWARLFANCMRGELVVALPESFGVKPLTSGRNRCGDGGGTYDGELDTLHGRRLINFSPGTLVLVASANPAARKRFDRYKVPYAWRTIDDPGELERYISFLKTP